VDAGNSRSYGVPVGYALNNTNFKAEEEKGNWFEAQLKIKEQVHYQFS